MDDAHDAGAETEPATPYMRLPWPLVTVGLLGILAILLGIGLFANRYFRPQVGLVPTPIVAVAPSPATDTPSPAFVATAPPAIAVTQPPAVSAATVEPASTPLAQAAVNPTATPAAATVAPSATSPSAPSPTPSALPTVEPQLADEIGRAYVMFWRVRSQALLELDTSHLPEVMDGDYLQSFETHLDDLRGQGHAIKSQVTLNYKVVQATSDDAIVIDRIEDDSFYVTPGTDQPLTDPANDVLRLQVRFRNIDGVWKVIESVSAD